jgi:hypothetical protein
MGSTASTTSFMSFVGVVVGVVVIFTGWQVYRFKRLQKEGVRVCAMITRVFTSDNTWYRRIWYLGERVCYVVAQWTDPRTQRRYTFQQKMDGDPIYAPGETIMVLVDLESPWRYYIYKE